LKLKKEFKHIQQKQRQKNDVKKKPQPLNLFQEMSDMEFEMEVNSESQNAMLKITPNDRSSPVFCFPELVCVAIEHLEKPGYAAYKKTNPIEDYFTLVVSSVKINSPYIDSICTTSTKELYTAAVEADVPFHRWHIWVENKLTNVYIETLYQNANPNTNIVTS